MDTFFGVPTAGLAVGLALAVAILLAAIGSAGLRNPALPKLGIRNLPRRPMQSALIVFGLALSTMIATSAFITGDTLSYSLRHSVIDALGAVDEIISPLSLDSVMAGGGGADPDGSGVVGALGGLSDLLDLPLISQAQYEALRAQVKDDPLIAGFAPIILMPGVVRDTTSGQSQPLGFIGGVGPEYEQQFGLHTADGHAVSTADLQPGLGDLVQNVSSLVALARAHGLDLTRLLAGLNAGSPGGGTTVPSPQPPPTSQTPGALINSLSGFDPNQLLRLLQDADQVLGQAGLELRRGEVYLDQHGASQLSAHAGDELTVLVGPIPIRVRVKDIIVDGGPLAPFGPVLVMPVSETQKLASILGLGDKYVAIAVSNRGDTQDSIGHSQEVTDRLRGLVLNQAPAEELAGALRSPDVRAAIDAQAGKIPASRQSLADSVGALQRALDQPGMSDALRRLLGDPGLGAWLGNLPLPVETQAHLKALVSQANPLSVEPVKAFAVQQAELAGAAAALLFTFAGGFSLVASVLLIFLVFVMLAASRKSEMGIARAVGMQQRQLVQTFVTEGTSYGLIAAVLGAWLGIGISYVMVRVIGNITSGFGSLAALFQIRFYMEPRSLIIAFCLGLLFTFAVVAFASWWVSRLNIVAAMRDLPEQVVPGRRPSRLMRIWSVARGPGLILLGAALAYTGLQTLSEFVTRLGVSLAVVSSWTRSESVTRLGVSLAVVGCGLAAHTLLLHSPVRPALRERLVFSLIGLGLLLVWALPWVAWLGITSLNQDAYFFVLAGIMMIGGAIWIVMYNVDGLLWVLNRLFGHFGVLAPVLRTATAYPLSNRLRSGLAMAMFAVVIFLVVTMATVINTQQLMASTSDSETAGFDMRLTSTSSIADLRTAIQSQPGLPVADITTIGRSTSRPIEVRQVGALRQSWSIRYPLIGVDAGFIDQAQAVYQFQLRAPGYDSDQAVWQALRERDDVVVAPAELVPPRGVDASRRSLFYLEGMHTGDQILPPITLEMRQPNATQGAVTSYQVIAVLEQDATAAGSGMLSSEPGLERLTGGPVSPGTYYVKVRQGAAARPVAQALERAFQLYGMTARTYQDITLEREGTVLALMQLLQGFMALGLLVGIAALGVISSRNVVDRRQQVGVLRAIGFQPGMVGLSFVLESSFVSLWGILIGTLLSLVLSANMVSNMAHFRAGLTLSPPWGEIIAIALIAYGFSLITTIVPAYQASRIYPAEALRYE